MRHRSHALRRRYAHENPLSSGAMIGLAVGGVALLGGVGYMLYSSSTAATGTTAATIPFNAADFRTGQNSGALLPTAMANGSLAYMLLSANTNAALVGTVQGYDATTQMGSFTVTGMVDGNGMPVGQGTKFPVGTTITGVPQLYYTRV